MKSTIKLLITGALFVMMLVLGNETFAQNSLANAISNPVNVAVPYLNYKGIADKELALREWVKDNPADCQTYVPQINRVS